MGLWRAGVLGLLLTLLVPRTAAAGAALDEAPGPTLDSAAMDAWQSLLLYAPRLLRPARGLVTTPGFYLATQGRSDPLGELRANLRQFTDSGGLQHLGSGTYACRFPARALFLSRWAEKATGHGAGRGDQVDQDTIDSLVLGCPELLAWMQTYPADAVSLVYTAHYLGNPASVFGHSFLRLHKKAPATQTSADELLDGAVAFEAFPTTKNPVLYALEETFGLFPAQTTATPLYIRIQQYNNHESRDLWEYELALTPEETQLLLFVLFEFRGQAVDYYYFDINCTYMLLAFLDAVRPQLALTARIKAWTVPSDGVRLAAQTPGFVTTVRYRPSSRSTFVARVARLAPDETGLIAPLADPSRPLISALAPLATKDPERRAEVVDAALDLLDYTGRVAGTAAEGALGQRRQALLGERAALPQTPPLVVPMPVERPDLGPDSSYLRLSARAEHGATPSTELLWRPELRDQLTVGGPADGVTLEIMRMRARYTPLTNKAEFAELVPVKLEAPATVTAFESPLSWGLGLAYLSADDSPPSLHGRTATGSARAGYGVQPWGSLRVYADLRGEAGLVQTAGRWQPLASAGMAAGVVVAPGNHWWRARLEATRFLAVLPGQRRVPYGDATLGLAVPLTQAAEVYLAADDREQRPYATLGLGWAY